MGSSKKRKYRADLGERQIELSIEGDEVQVDDRRLGFAHESLSDQHISLILDGRSYSAVVIPDRDGRYRVVIGGKEFEIQLKDERDLLLERYGLAEAAGAGAQAIRAPMPGLVLSIAVEPGQEVQRGSGLAVLEAMKMENELRAEHDGVVKAVHVAPGDAVGKSDLLMEIE